MKLTCKARSCLSGMIFGTANGPFSPGRVCNEENSTLRAKIVDPKKKLAQMENAHSQKNPKLK